MTRDDTPSDDEPVWRTRDGREIPFAEMDTEHVRSAQRIIAPWSRREVSAERRADLAGWRKAFASELRRRERAERKAGGDAPAAAEPEQGRTATTRQRALSQREAANRDAAKEKRRERQAAWRARVKEWHTAAADADADRTAPPQRPRRAPRPSGR